MELLEGMLQKDKDEFKRISNRLLSNCLFVKEIRQVVQNIILFLSTEKSFGTLLEDAGLSA